MKKEEYNKAMEEMACWEAQSHLKKCGKCRREFLYSRFAKLRGEIEKMENEDWDGCPIAIKALSQALKLIDQEIK